MSRTEILHEIWRIDQGLAENRARIKEQREIIGQLEPLSREAKRAKTMLYVFLFAQARFHERRQALLSQVTDDDLSSPQ